MNNKDKNKTDFDYWDKRKVQVRSLVLNHIKDKFPSIIDVHIFVFPMIWKSYTEFNIIIDVDINGFEYFEFKSTHNRQLRKDVFNFCKYILGINESLNNISLNAIKDKE
jgi:hypothetical protein